LYKFLYAWFFLLDKYHEKLPEKQEIKKEILPLLFESISINTNFTSKIGVSILFNKEKHVKICFRSPKMVVYQYKLVIKLSVLY